MANNIPVFDFGKDSYILKHKLNYNTTNEGALSAATYGILFTDYDIARKTQSVNATNFNPIIINSPIANLDTIKLTYYDQEYTIGLYNRQAYTELVMSGVSFDDGATFISNRNFQAYYVPSGYTVLFQPGDYFNIYFHEILSGTTGTTVWSHFGASGETWVATGVTIHNVPWQVTGTTTNNGYSTGITTWTVTDYNPILKYQAKCTEISGTTGLDDWYFKFERKLEDYIYNTLMKIASNSSFTTLRYTLEGLDFSDRSYYGVKYIFEESKWSDYFSVSATTNQLVIQPIDNKNDLYFDYDNVRITLYTTGDTETYAFETDMLYTKYKLDRFLDQLGFDSGTTVFYDHPTITTSSGWTGRTEYIIELTNSGDTQYFLPFSYIYATGSTNIEHICLVLEITGNTIKILTPRTNMSIGETITIINNMHTIYDISRMLYECYINIEGNVDDYRKLGVQRRKNIYRTYASIFENLTLTTNQAIRDRLTGMIFENENAVFVFKLYHPANFQDERLTYEPIEIDRIGKNKKTSIPVKVYGITSN